MRKEAALGFALWAAVTSDAGRRRTTHYLCYSRFTPPPSSRLSCL